ncbi:dTDP-4-dehydro-6-deoxyglucose aminotransferase [Rhodoblastus sphagnicola]|uniref:dTDP-4-dehydro-6-deoxyglucose aminotransferase n=1 Tax=Rhodoblastus sphagnicola TaxID=333368 RepID=A0A2S6NAN0_9HYPH|nr:aminotransferase class I/II-fold pyridoxal phosphate-dependent enzyme [Rhodoblastus sphagnicola]MBB4200281.1 dTDP-4-amino-4,6-dideoxygalactose transaminase [Rhodoblastus sphagnicola]PPQ31666.1 dTDP-4-dehydro-6-deoxyglucose aminotransferase [Rhodoblastus sphagnicola]
MKTIRSAVDLAINGATPAFAEPLHVGRPNIGDQAKFIRLAADMLERRWLSNAGPLVQEFEARLAAELGAKHVVVMCNGTVALEIAIRALGMTGEVIVPSYTFVATAHALFWQGVTPVFADIDSVTHTLDPAAVRRMITPRTTGIIGVHLWGRGCPVSELQDIADEHGLKLLFDAAHAFGCSIGNRAIGGFGEAEVFSFHATKFFNSFEGGAVATNNDALAETMRLMRNFGFAGYDNVIHPGTNGKMTEICAAMGLVNLDDTARVIEANRRNHLAYQAAIDDVPGLTILPFDDAERNNYQYVVMEVGPESHASRDEIIAALHAENILARRYFWPGCHKMKPYRDLFPHAGLVLPNTEAVANRVIVLPTGTTLPEGAVETIASVCRILQGGGAVELLRRA